jgi:hypothetical protein
MLINVAVYLQENQLTSLAGGGNIFDLSMLQVLDLHSNCFVSLPDEIGHLRNLRVSMEFVSSIKCGNVNKYLGGIIFKKKTCKVSVT